MQNAAAALPFIRGHEVVVAVGLVVLLTAMNLRGVRESGKAFAIPVYVFMVSVIGMGVVGLVRELTGTLPQAESAGLTLAPEQGFESLGGFAMMFLLLRAFSSGCAALTGVEAISNGVPAFKKPKSRNAATTLLLMGVIAVTMLMSMLDAGASGPASSSPRTPRPSCCSTASRSAPSYVQDTIMGQLSQGGLLRLPPRRRPRLDRRPALILILAANTAFNGFPVLGSILAKDGYLPRQLHTRGDRLAFSNGILILAGAAALLIVIYDAEVTKLIQLYIVGVFVSFTLSQTGMIRHWNRHLRLERDPRGAAPDDAQPGHQRASARPCPARCWSSCCSPSSCTVPATPSPRWSCSSSSCCGIRKHYDAGRERAARQRRRPRRQLLPRRVHAIVLVSKIHKPTLRALAYARATRPSKLEAITVNVEPDETKALQEEWDRRDIPVPLKVARLALPRDHPAGRRLRQVAAARQPPRRRHGLHPRVRRRAVVGAAAAQPERAAAQGPAAVHARRHGGQRAVAARVLRQGAEERLDGPTAGSVRRGQ